MESPKRGRKATYERLGFIVMMVCAALALTALAWAASLPDGTVG